ncbi:MAG: FMN-binding protein [Solobacterium sp.]|jgi:electron transport complex protein RnfG|nr:FMN-binding protein [Solobacterium sp.]MBQ1446164.1 FMN-binding protein [Solobacterium sp.]MBR2726332.1 FMN-binding protein [Solobacterium sp.]MCR5371952.1 FMN-binding protein [Solobacterium sp.]
MNRDTTLYKVIVLGAVSAVCGCLLSLVNGITSPIIEAAKIAKEKANLEMIYPGAEFTAVNDYDDPSGLITGVYEAEGKGMVYKAHVVGYSSNGIDFLVAFNDDGTVGGFQVLSHTETNGFGSRCFEEDFMSRIRSLSVGDDVPLLSGATLTSTALKNGIEAAGAMFSGK